MLRKATLKAVPDIDLSNGQRQIYEFRIAKVRFHLLVYIIWHLILGDQRYRFSPFQCRSFSVVVERCFPPRANEIQTLFRFTQCPCILGVHIDTPSATINLRSSQVNQIQQRWFQTGMIVDVGGKLAAPI